MIDRKLLIRRISFTAYFVVAFLIFLVLLFPVDRIKGRLEAEVRQRTPYDLTVARISPRFFNSVVLHDVVIAEQSTGKVLFESQSANTSVSLWGLLRGILSLDVKAKAYGGEILAKAQQGPSKQYLQIDATNLELGSYTLLKNSGYRVSGKLGGNLEMNGDNGKAKFWIKGLSSRELKLKGFPVPDLDFEQSWLEADIKGDRMTIRKLELDGKDIKVRGAGDIVLRERGSLNVTIRLKPSEIFARQQAGFFSMLKTKDADGYYQLSLFGTVDAPVPRF